MLIRKLWVMYILWMDTDFERGIFVGTWGDIVGHEKIKEYFRHAIRVQQVSHAYSLNGEDGSGKNMLADALAAALLCAEPGHLGHPGYAGHLRNSDNTVNPGSSDNLGISSSLDSLCDPGEPCGKCRACRQVMSGNHPDLRRVVHEKPKTISVDEVRQQLVEDMQIKPYSGGYKVYILDDAQKMTPQAQNALLKTIEEPPAYGIILILTNALEALLPTIRSRCVTINLRSVDDRRIRDHLMRVKEIPDYQAGMCTAFAQGNIGKAMMMADLEDFSLQQRLVLRIVKHVHEMEIYEVTSAVKELQAYKDEMDRILELMTVWYRDLLVMKACGKTSGLIYLNEQNLISKRAQEVSYEGIGRIFEAIDEARARLAANVNFDLVTELLLLTIKENENG